MVGYLRSDEVQENPLKSVVVIKKKKKSKNKKKKANKKLFRQNRSGVRDQICGIK